MEQQAYRRNRNTILARIANHKYSLLRLPQSFYLLIFTFLYGAIWSYIGILKMLSLNAYVFDLGINSERGWQILHTNLGLHGYIATLLNSGIVFPLSPLTGSGNFYVMIIFQAFSIALVGPILYHISKLKGNDSKVSLLISIAFFLYFPVYGIMWFDFHYQAFFLPLFVLGYLFYMRKNYYASTALFFLSGIVRYPYSIFPLAFAFIELLLVFLGHKNKADKRRIVSMTFLFALTLTWTVLGFLFLGLSSTIPHNVPSVYTFASVTVWTRILVILLYAAPLLFIPITRIRWVIFLIPSFYLFLTSSYIWFTYPHVFQGQYAAGVVPFMFLALVDYISYLRNNTGRIKLHRGKEVKLNIRISPKRIVATIVVVLILLNIFLAPFSPLNNQYGDNFNFHQNTSYNAMRYSEMNSMLNMIPISVPYVAYQNNIPEVLPRVLPLNGAILMGGYLGSFNNLTVGEAMNNSWSISLGGYSTHMPIYYAIADAANQNFYLENNSMYSLVQDMYSSGNYVVVSEGYGLILLSSNYSGVIQNFIPENLTLNANFVKSPANSATVTGNWTTNFSSGNDESIASSSYLFPGKYNLNINLTQSYLNTTENNLPVVIYIHSGQYLLKQFDVNISMDGKIGHANLSMQVNQIYGNVWFSASMNSSMISNSKIGLNIFQNSAYQKKL